MKMQIEQSVACEIFGGRLDGGRVLIRRGTIAFQNKYFFHGIMYEDFYVQSRDKVYFIETKKAK